MRSALLCVALSACAHTEDPGLRPFAPIPTDATVGTLAMADGTQLATLTWLPASEPRGAVVIVHGLRDHAARYAAFASRLVAAGYAVHAFDLRGHGHSAGPRVAPEVWHAYVDDLRAVLATVPTSHPVFLFGHSMGGAIATLATIEGAPSAGLILSAPALAIDAAPMFLAATRLAATVTPRASALDLPSAGFSSDPEVVRALKADPFVQHTPGPARTAAGLLDGIRAIWAHPERVAVPLLALHGTRDALTAPSGSRELVRRAASNDKTLRIYDGLYHDLLHEPRGKQIADDIVAWLDAHTGGTSIVAPPVFTGRLRGEPGQWTQAISFGGGVSVADDAGFAGIASVQLGKLRPVGWHGDITGTLLVDSSSIALRPLGLAVRAGAASLGISGGVALTTNVDLGTSFGVAGELPVGPVHLSLLAERHREIENTHLHGPLASDQLITSLSVRAGRDHRYWPATVAGVGPLLTVGAAWIADAEVGWFATLGVQLFGSD